MGLHAVLRNSFSEYDLYVYELRVGTGNSQAYHVGMINRVGMSLISPTNSEYDNRILYADADKPVKSVEVRKRILSPKIIIHLDVENL